MCFTKHFLPYIYLITDTGITKIRKNRVNLKKKEVSSMFNEIFGLIMKLKQ